MDDDDHNTKDSSHDSGDEGKSIGLTDVESSDVEELYDRIATQLMNIHASLNHVIDTISKNGEVMTTRTLSRGTSVGAFGYNDEDESQSQTLSIIVTKQHCEICSIKKEYASFQRMLKELYVPRDIVRLKKKRLLLKENIIISEELLEKAQFHLSKMMSRKDGNSGRQTRRITAPDVHGCRPGNEYLSIDEELGRASLSNADLIRRGLTIMRNDTLSLCRSKSMIEEMKEIGNAVSIEIHRQGSKLRSTDKSLQRVVVHSADAKRGLRQLIRGQQFDFCQKSMMLLCALGLVSIIMAEIFNYNASETISSQRLLIGAPGPELEWDTPQLQ